MKMRHVIGALALTGVGFAVAGGTASACYEGNWPAYCPSTTLATTTTVAPTTTGAPTSSAASTSTSTTTGPLTPSTLVVPPPPTNSTISVEPSAPTTTASPTTVAASEPDSPGSSTTQPTQRIASPPSSGRLPETGTEQDVIMAIGASIILIGALLFWLARPRKTVKR